MHAEVCVSCMKCTFVMAVLSEKHITCAGYEDQNYNILGYIVEKVRRVAFIVLLSPSHRACTHPAVSQLHAPSMPLP